MSVLSLGDITCAVGPIGLLLGRLANFINSELWGRHADASVPWAMVFPNGGPLPRHPSQLYEAGLEGIVLFHHSRPDDPGRCAEAAWTDPRRLHLFYALARITGEFFREPDPQLGFLWGGLTMGMLLSVPMIFVGLVLMVRAWRKPQASLELSPGKKA